LSAILFLYNKVLEALARKYPNAGREWAWQWLFPARKLSVDPRSGIRLGHADVTTTMIYVVVAVMWRRASVGAGLRGNGGTDVT
jgi:hypothetical protein